MSRYLLFSILLAMITGSAALAQVKDSRPTAPTPAKFVDVTSSLGVQFQHAAPHTSKKYLLETMGSGVALFDYDNDARLDLFVVNGAEINDPSSPGTIPQKTGPKYWNRLYHQKPDGTFQHVTDITKQAGFAKSGKGLGIAIADFNGDGHIDVFIANDSVPEFLYQNKGDGTFEEVGLFAGVGVDGDGHAYAGMGVDFADYENDGLPDIVVSDLAYQKYSLYHNNGDGTFAYSSDSTGLGSMTFLHSGWGMRFIDYDNDGWKDLLVAQAHVMDTIELNYPQLRYREPMLLAHNTGQGFVDVSNQSGAVFHESWASRGMAIGDIDNDGRLDAVITENGGPMHILHNETSTQNHWLTLNLVGHKSNRDAIGAAVKIITAQGEQYATVTTCGSYLSSGDKRVHFGLGLQSTIKEINIRWPSGIRQTLHDVKGDQILRVDEPTK